MAGKQYVRKDNFDLLRDSQMLNFQYRLDCPHVDKSSGFRQCSEPKFASRFCTHYHAPSTITPEQMNEVFEELAPEDGITSVIKNICSLKPPQR